MSAIKARGRAMLCCAAPPRPDPDIPACPELADDEHGFEVIDGVTFAFCSPAHRRWFTDHGYGPEIAADIRSQMHP